MPPPPNSHQRPLQVFAAFANAGDSKGWLGFIAFVLFGTLGAFGLAVAPGDPNVIYVGTGEGTLRGNVFHHGANHDSLLYSLIRSDT